MQSEMTPPPPSPKPFPSCWLCGKKYVKACYCLEAVDYYRWCQKQKGGWTAVKHTEPE